MQSIQALQPLGVLYRTVADAAFTAQRSFRLNLVPGTVQLGAERFGHVEAPTSLS